MCFEQLENMPRPCDVVGCPNGVRSVRWSRNNDNGTDDTGYHLVPRKEPLRSMWLRAVPLRHRDRQPKELRVCSLHFRAEDYEINRDVSRACNMPFRALLRRNVVPSILPASAEPQNLMQEPPQNAAECVVEENMYAIIIRAFDDSVIDHSYAKVTVDAGTQGNLSTGVVGIGKSKAVQVIHLSGKNIGIQVNLNMKMSKEKGTQVSENKRKRRRRR